MEYQLIKLEDADRNLVKYESDQIGLDNYIQKELDYLDVSRTLAENPKFRIVQTIDWLYKVTIAKVHYAISLVESVEERKMLLNKLAEKHRANLEYEKDNPCCGPFAVLLVRRCPGVGLRTEVRDKRRLFFGTFCPGRKVQHRLD